MAHGDLAGQPDGRTVVVVFASPVGRSLLHFARDTGFRTVLVEPEPERLSEADRGLAGAVLTGADAAGDRAGDARRPDRGPKRPTRRVRFRHPGRLNG